MVIYFGIFQGSLNGNPHIFGGTIKVDVNVAGDLGVISPLKKNVHCLRVGWCHIS